MSNDLSPLAAALRHTLQYANREGIYQNDKWELLATTAREFLGGAKHAAKPAAPTERPTCATCPYFTRNKGRDGADRAEGVCHRHAPRYMVGCATDWAVTDADDFCGDHPDMPAWTAARAEGGR